MTDLTMVEAIRMALSCALEEDENVIIFGEDVGIDGAGRRADVHALLDRVTMVTVMSKTEVRHLIEVN